MTASSMEEPFNPSLDQTLNASNMGSDRIERALIPHEPSKLA